VRVRYGLFTGYNSYFLSLLPLDASSPTSQTEITAGTNVLTVQSMLVRSNMTRKPTNKFTGFARLVRRAYGKLALIVGAASLVNVNPLDWQW